MAVRLGDGGLKCGLVADATSQRHHFHNSQLALINMSITAEERQHVLGLAGLLAESETVREALKPDRITAVKAMNEAKLQHMKSVIECELGYEVLEARVNRVAASPQIEGLSSATSFYSGCDMNGQPVAHWHQDGTGKTKGYKEEFSLVPPVGQRLLRATWALAGESTVALASDSEEARLLDHLDATHNEGCDRRRKSHEKHMIESAMQFPERVVPKVVNEERCAMSAAVPHVGNPHCVVPSTLDEAMLFVKGWGYGTWHTEPHMTVGGQRVLAIFEFTVQDPPEDDATSTAPPSDDSEAEDF